MHFIILRQAAAILAYAAMPVGVGIYKTASEVMTQGRRELIIAAGAGLGRRACCRSSLYMPLRPDIQFMAAFGTVFFAPMAVVIILIYCAAIIVFLLRIGYPVANITIRLVIGRSLIVIHKGMAGFRTALNIIAH